MMGIRRTVAALGLVATSLLGLAVVAQPAGADVPRWQILTFKYFVVDSLGRTHQYTVSTSPKCDDSFSGTGLRPAPPDPTLFHEVINGTATGTHLSYTSVYDSGFTYSLDQGTFVNFNMDFTGSGHDSEGATFTLSGTRLSTTSTHFRNHGQYVNSVPRSQKDAAARSCIGKPIFSGGHDRD